MKYMPKVLEAIGIAALMVGLVQGVYGDEWGELYLFIGGIVIFIVGRQWEKRMEKSKQQSSSSSS